MFAEPETPEATSFSLIESEPEISFFLILHYGLEVDLEPHQYSIQETLPHLLHIFAVTSTLVYMRSPCQLRVNDVLEK
jgi:hypothetical protein